MYPAMANYSEENCRIFFGNMLVPNANFVGFKDLGEGWAKDMQKVFYMGQLVHGADPFFFKVLSSGYAEDHNHVYQYGQRLPDVDPFNFQPPLNTGMILPPPPYPSTTIIHHPSPFIHPYQSTMTPVYIPSNHSLSMTHVYNHPPPPPPIPPENISAHVDVSRGTFGRHYTRRNDLADCCILI